jgi:hypothetical protein
VIYRMGFTKQFITFGGHHLVRIFPYHKFLVFHQQLGSISSTYGYASTFQLRCGAQMDRSCVKSVKYYAYRVANFDHIWLWTICTWSKLGWKSNANGYYRDEKDIAWKHRHGSNTETEGWTGSRVMFTSESAIKYMEYPRHPFLVQFNPEFT